MSLVRYLTHRLVLLSLLVSLGIAGLLARNLWVVHENALASAELANRNLSHTLAVGLQWVLATPKADLETAQKTLGIEEAKQQRLLDAADDARKRAQGFMESGGAKREQYEQERAGRRAIQPLQESNDFQERKNKLQKGQEAEEKKKAQEREQKRRKERQEVERSIREGFDVEGFDVRRRGEDRTATSAGTAEGVAAVRSFAEETEGGFAELVQALNAAQARIAELRGQIRDGET